MKIYKLDKRSCWDLLQEAKDASQQSIWQSSLTFWDKSVRNHIYGSCVVALTPRNVHDRVMEEVLKYMPEFCNEGMVKSCTTMFYIWQPYSGISKHDDRGYPFAATIYLNQGWDIDWGGNFLYYDNIIKSEDYMYDHENWKVVVPELGNMIVNNDKTMHLVTPISPTCPELRYTIQIWGHYDDVGIPLK